MARNVPFNLEAEQSVLGCILIDNNMFLKIADELDSTDFYDSKNQNIYAAMRSLYKQQITIDFTTLNSELQNKNTLVAAGGLIYLNTILDCVFTTSNIDDYISVVRDSSMKRKIIDAATGICEAGFDGALNTTDYLDYAERIMFDITAKRKTENFVDIDSVVDTVVERTHANRNKGDGITGLSTGFENLDALTSGLQDDNLIILAARPAMGKSAYAMNIAINAAKVNAGANGTGAHVAVFSLEMSQEQLVQRMISSESQVHLGSIQHGNMTAQDFALFENANDNLKRLNVHFSDSPSVTISDIIAKFRKQKYGEGLDLVVIDYLQLISGINKGGSRQDEVSNISRGLKQMARELKVPVIALAQLSREVEKREDKRPIMADLRESGAIEQDADLILFIYRDEYYNKQSTTPGVAEVLVAKNRAGASGNALKYLFNGSTQTFRVLSNEGE